MLIVSPVSQSTHDLAHEAARLKMRWAVRQLRPTRIVGRVDLVIDELRLTATFFVPFHLAAETKLETKAC